MSESNNNNFDELKRLLKLKQHEIPPPGYFNHFSGDVISRIRAGESTPQSIFDHVESDSLLAKFLGLFQAKPGVVGGLATSLCVMLLVGVVLAEHTDETPTSSEMASMQPSAPGDTATLASTTSLAPADPNSGIAISTNPVAAASVASFQPQAALFGSQQIQQNPLFQSATFLPPKQ